ISEVIVTRAPVKPRARCELLLESVHPGNICSLHGSDEKSSQTPLPVCVSEAFPHRTVRSSSSQSLLTSGNGTASSSFVWMVPTSSKLSPSDVTYLPQCLSIHQLDLNLGGVTVNFIYPEPL
ncbi:hypothetical protein A6R68_05607, partial [Neotoma lepida]